VLFPSSAELFLTYVRLVPVLRQAAAKLPTQMEFISRDTPPRLGNMLIYPPKPPALDAAATEEASATSTASA